MTGQYMLYQSSYDDHAFCGLTLGDATLVSGIAKAIQGNSEQPAQNMSESLTKPWHAFFKYLWYSLFNGFQSPLLVLTKILLLNYDPLKTGDLLQYPKHFCPSNNSIPPQRKVTLLKSMSRSALCDTQDKLYHVSESAETWLVAQLPPRTDAQLKPIFFEWTCIS